MKLTIQATRQIKQYGVIIDDKGRFWRLPFTDTRNHKRKVKELKVFYHKGMNAVRINNKIYNESFLRSISRAHSDTYEFIV